MNKKTELVKVMTTKLKKVREYDTIESVAQLFDKHDFHHIPVENEEGKMVGIISKTDFMNLSYGMSLFNNPQKDIYNRALYKTTLVKDVMSKIVVSLRPEDSVELAARIFRENLFHALPIVDEEKVVGMVTTFDLLKFAFK